MFVKVCLIKKTQVWLDILVLVWLEILYLRKMKTIVMIRFYKDNNFVPIDNNL